MSLIVATEKCHLCSKGRSPQDLIKSATGTKICTRCFNWHMHAVDVLAGNPPRGCQGCHLDFAELERRSSDGNVRLYVHQKDGVYQILCRSCSDAYMPKRRDLYQHTQFGAALNL